MASNFTFQGSGARTTRPSSLRPVCTAPLAQRYCWLLKPLTSTGSSEGTLSPGR